MTFGLDWDSLVTGSLDVSIKSVVASPSFLSPDAGYECTLALFWKAHCLGLKLYIGRHHLKLRTIFVVLCQESTDRTVGQGIRLTQTRGVLHVTDSWSAPRCHILFAVAGSHSNGFSTSTDSPITSCLYVQLTSWSLFYQDTDHAIHDRCFVVEAARLRCCSRSHLRWFSLGYWK